MSFVEPAFVGFMLAVLLGYAALPTSRAQNGLVVLASAVFYGWVHPWMLGLLLFSATLDYAVALGIARHPGHRRKLLALSVAGNLAVLGWFKYLDFFAESLVVAAARVGIDLPIAPLGLLLPAGISFYTFQTMGYTIDVFRGRIRPTRSYVDHLAFVMFFPQLVAGPIERAGRLLPQLAVRRQVTAAALRSGLTLALWGAFLKVVVADTLAPYVDTVFLLSEPPGVLLWTAAAVFGVQLYADFQAYTNLARGTARMLGIELVTNFREPFLATSTPDFWRRWHTSLSSWVRDYLLGPLLGAGPTSPGRLVFALLASFALLGLWHGAGWHYLAFGLWHGAWVLVYLAVGPAVSRRVGGLPGATALAVVFHAVFVLLPGAVLFREPDLVRGIGLLGLPPWQGDGDAWLVAGYLAGLASLLSFPIVADWGLRRFVLPRSFGRDLLLPVETTLWAVIVLALVVFQRTTARDFIYFQF